MREADVWEGRIRSYAEALHRNADEDARGIQVSADCGKVTLTGQVRSWAEKEQGARRVEYGRCLEGRKISSWSHPEYG